MATDKKVGLTLALIAVIIGLVLVVSGNDAGSVVEIGLLK